MNEARLWTILAQASSGSGQGSMARLVASSAAGRQLPDAPTMERLERKVTVADTLYSDYDANWRPLREHGIASDTIRGDLSVLFLLNALSATDRAIALKRLNAADALISGIKTMAPSRRDELSAMLSATAERLLSNQPNSR